MNRVTFHQRRTKIVCTIGPATGTVAMMERLVKAGMNIARLNLSHGSASEHQRRIKIIEGVSRRLDKTVAVLMDLPGPKYRVGELPGGALPLVKGKRVILTTEAAADDSSRIPVFPAGLAQYVRKGNTILIDDGAMQLRVTDQNETEIGCTVIVGGMLTDGRGVVVPGMKTPGPFLTDTLRRHVLFAIAEKPDFVALSFVSRAEDVADVRAFMEDNGAYIPIIAKIERGEALKDFDRILAASDAVMVARGDLGVDIPLQRVPMAQKTIIAKCNQAGKPVITATQMLESMIHAARPTRAEVTDVANAIFDGTDATMLSAETSVGKYPVQAVQMMARVAGEAEAGLPYKQMLIQRSNWLAEETSEMISYNACHTAQRLGAAAIVAFTESGSTARRVSKYRPQAPVIAISPSGDVCRRLMIHWGVHPLKIPALSSVDQLFATAGQMCKELGLGKAGDQIIVTAGVPIGTVGSTNLLKVESIE